MATDYGARFSKGLGCTRHAMGGAAEGLGIEALAGDTEMVTVFDDFDGITESDTFGVATNWETVGWVLTDCGVPTNDYVAMNDPNTQTDFMSEMVLVPGDTADTGGNMLLDHVTGAVASPISLHEFRHLWIPPSTVATVLDGTRWVFACRIGFQSGDAVGDWDSKCFIGWAQANDTSIMTAATGVITIASTGPLVGFHIPEDGSIDGISHRTAATVMAEGTNFTELAPAGTVDGEAATDKMWFDLALQMDIVDMSDASNNGYTRFFWRRVLPNEPLGDWVAHPTVLTNQTPNNASVMVPCIEAMTGGDANVCAVGLDWWAFGRSRLNR